MLTTFSFLLPYFSLQLAKDAEQVNKNIKKQCWNVWYEAYLLSSDESSLTTGPSTGTPATPALSSGARRSSSNFENAPIASTVLNSSGLRKPRKVYCYISKKVCVYLWFSASFKTHSKISCCFVVALLNYFLFISSNYQSKNSIWRLFLVDCMDFASDPQQRWVIFNYYTLSLLSLMSLLCVEISIST